MRWAGLALVLLGAIAASGQSTYAPSTTAWGDAHYAPIGSAGMPSGMVAFVVSGSCPSGWTEVTALDGVMLRGTLAAHGDVGAAGGHSTITPSGTVSQASFTGASDTTSAVSAGTPAGTNGTVSFTPEGTNGTASFTPAGTNNTVSFTPAGTNAASATSGNCASTNIAAGTGSTTACKATAPNLTVTKQTFTGSSGTVPAETFTGSSGTVPAETFSGSAGTVPAETFTGSALGTHTHTVTPTGTINPQTFTGNAADPSPSYLKVIFCSKN